MKEGVLYIVHSTLRHARDSGFYKVEKICDREADAFLVNAVSLSGRYIMTSIYVY